MDCLDKRIDDYIGHVPEVDEDISTKAATGFRKYMEDNA